MHLGPPEDGPRCHQPSFSSRSKLDTWTITPPRQYNVAPVHRRKRRLHLNFVNASVYPYITIQIQVRKSGILFLSPFLAYLPASSSAFFAALVPQLSDRAAYIGILSRARLASLDIRAVPRRTAPAPETSESIRNSCGQFDSRASPPRKLTQPVE